LIVVGVLACGSFTTTNQTSITTTIDERPLMIDAVYNNLVEVLPTEFSLDVFLPTLVDWNMMVLKQL